MLKEPGSGLWKLGDGDGIDTAKGTERETAERESTAGGGRASSARPYE